MRLLFFLVSLIFAFIFYSFHNLSSGKDIYGNIFTGIKAFQPLTGNLLYETGFFIVLAFVFLVVFNTVWEKKTKYENIFLRNYYFIFWAFFACVFVFPFLYKDNFIFLAIIFFVFWECCFNIIAKFEFFREQKLGIKYFWLLLNYLAVFVSLYYSTFISYSVILFSILLYSCIFNYFLHKKYINYISLWVSGIIWIFLLYFFAKMIYWFVLTLI